MATDSLADVNRAGPPSITTALAFVNTALMEAQQSIAALTRVRIALELLAQRDAPEPEREPVPYKDFLPSDLEAMR